MYSEVISGMSLGIEGMLIRVETDISAGLPMLSMVGYLASSVKEAGERVRTAIKNSGFILPASRITVNLSPADIRKDGASFDLPIAAAILISMNIIPQTALKDTLVLGEMGLSGDIKAVDSVLPVVHFARLQGIKKVVLPYDNVKEAMVVDDIEVTGVKDLREMVDYLLGDKTESVFHVKTDMDNGKREFERQKLIQDIDFDMADICGQDSMKRGVMIAVAGFHNILMSGEAGSGKSMIAKSIPGIMPSLTYEESLELTKIYSISGMMKGCDSLMRKRPFRSPHHTVTETALIGGGMIPKPGEVSLADCGILFLDELPEYKKKVIECLRQPMEDKKILISRHHASFEYPADFMLVAAMNPCPCGHYPDRSLCRCSEQEINSYRNKISYPIMDRIDIRLEVKQVKYKELTNKTNNISSLEMRQKVEAARERQLHRYKGENFLFNSQMPQNKVEEYIKINQGGEKLLEKEFESQKLSARGYFRIRKLARTVADLSDREDIREDDVYEAMFFRNIPDRGKAI
ncbi:MAG: YifB family Mg chelatase-like AAA ATPase [Eubacterium sp.]|nr:YifB family Mg chelatase-like AAA ATPase [Eubacterium sp.]